MEKKIIRIPQDAELPLIGLVQIGIIDRGTNLLQLRPTTICPLSCIFCSVDAGPNSKYHFTEYVVKLDYFLDWLKEVMKFKGKIHAFIDSVGDPLTYPKIVDLVQAIKELRVESLALETSGYLLNENLVDELAEIGLERLNISIHALDEELAKKLAGCEAYQVERIIEIIRYIAESQIELLVTPVWIPGLNDDEIPTIIELIKKINRNKRWPFLGIQKYEEHKFGRKPRGVKAISWWKFHQKIREWEKEFNLKLTISSKDFGIEKRVSLPLVFERGEKIKVRIAAEGWMKNEMIGIAKDRSITLVDCRAKIGDEIRAKILRTKDNIYIARS
ncbi:MAG: radical SAM protein [Candidatus Aenigmarchaeota archaeon]|nr:radical SAM protein [Candidatus Aenigmarchaeota archaeon]